MTAPITRPLSLRGFSVTVRHEPEATPFTTPEVHLTLKSGEVACLIGGVGSGKSLLLQGMTPCVPPHTRVEAPLDPSWRVAIIPQDPRWIVLPTDTVASLFSDADERSPAPSKAIFSCAQLAAQLFLDLDRVARLAFRDLSSSERHRVLVVLAFRGMPDLLLYDGFGETVTAVEQKAIERLVERTARLGVRFLLATRTIRADLPPDWKVHRLNSSGSIPPAVPLVRPKTMEADPYERAVLDVRRLRVLHASARDSRTEAPVVGSASLSIKRGAALAVLGPSGSGKSHLLEAIAGLLRIVDGRLRLHGVEIALGDRSRAFRRKVQLVFENPHAVLEGERTVREHLSAACAVAGKSAQEVPRWLERLSLAPRILDLPADRLSSAEAARVDLVRSLIVEPDVLLVDSPSSLGLEEADGVVQAVLEAERARGMALVVATNSPEVALSTSAEVAIFFGGRVVEHGPVKTVLEEPLHPFTEAFVARVGTAYSPAADPQGCPYVHHCAYRDLERCRASFPETTSVTTDRGSRETACHFPIFSTQQAAPDLPAWAQQAVPSSRE